MKVNGAHWGEVVDNTLLTMLGETDRAYAVLAGSLVDNLLRAVLEAFMRASTPKGLFEGYGPLATLGAKIDMAYALGLISRGERTELNLFRKIRDEFAHSLDPELSFSSSGIRSLVDTLALSLTKFLGGKRRPPRRDFESAFLVMLGFLLGRLDHVKRVEELPEFVDSVVRGVRGARDQSEK